MSARNSRAAKAARRNDRAREDREVTERGISAEFGSPLVEVHSMSELVAARRKDRAREDRKVTERGISAQFGSPLVEVHSISELMDFPEHGEPLPCGCDAHSLLHEMLVQ
jgi:hypothetical protein